MATIRKILFLTREKGYSKRQDSASNEETIANFVQGRRGAKAGLSTTTSHFLASSGQKH